MLDSNALKFYIDKSKRWERSGVYEANTSINISASPMSNGCIGFGSPNNRTMCQNVSRFNRITLQWLPVHRGIDGNERANDYYSALTLGNWFWRV